MKKSRALKIINPVIAVLFVFQAGVGIFHNQIPYEIFSRFHLVVGILFIFFICIHIVLNWSWVKSTFLIKK